MSMWLTAFLCSLWQEEDVVSGSLVYLYGFLDLYNCDKSATRLGCLNVKVIKSDLGLDSAR